MRKTLLGEGNFDNDFVSTVRLLELVIVKASPPKNTLIQNKWIKLYAAFHQMKPVDLSDFYSKNS